MMSDETVLETTNGDRLPWLEAVEDDDGEGGFGLGKMVGVILTAVLAVALIVAGVLFLQSRDGANEGQGELIAAPEEDYRVRPDDAGGMEVEGEGDSAFAASAGDSPEGRINPGAAPEQPVQGRRAAAPAAPTVGSTARVPASSGQLADAASGRLIQLGAYSSEAVANSAWTALGGRYSYLGSLTKTVSTVQSGGRTLYRLRVDAGSAEAARSVCGRLRTAREACSVVVN